MEVVVRSIMENKVVNETNTKTVYFDWGWIGMDEDGKLLISIVRTEKYNISRDYSKTDMALHIMEVK